MKKKLPAVIAAAIILSIAMVAGASAAGVSGTTILSKASGDTSIHPKTDVNSITGEIAEPPELSSSASALAQEKEWYEYVYYSEEPVGYYYISDNTRLSFYDPYDYASSLIMEVDDSLTDWSSSNSLQVSYTTGNSLTNTKGKSSESSTSTQVASGSDISETKNAESTVTTTVEGKVHTYSTSKTDAATDTSHEDNWHLDATIGSEIGTEVGPVVSKVTAKITANTSDGKGWADVTNTIGERNTHDNGYTEDDTTTTSKTTYGDANGQNKATVITSTIAARVTSATGSSASTSVSMSTDNSTTITKTYDAAYFNASGAPLQWKIIKYTVMMPMRYQIEYLIDGEWVFGDSSYCLLRTIQGTCRAWLQNNTAYYEHWGTGEAVTWNEFWSTFFTKESLMDAYKNRLYPNT